MDRASLMGRPAPDPARIAEARQLACAGTSRSEIAKRLGVGERTVSRWLGRAPGRPVHGEPSRTTAWRRAREAAEAEELAALLGSGR